MPGRDSCLSALTWSVLGAQKHQKKGDRGQLSSIGRAGPLPNQLCTACSQQGGYGADDLISSGYDIAPKACCAICENATCACTDSVITHC